MTIQFVEETGSTNQDLVDRLKNGDYVPEGFWLVADRQTRGRGRLGRDWFDGSGNFMGSTLVRPGPGDPGPATLAFVVGLAVHEAVSRVLGDACELFLKWPNDLLLGGAKLSGVLLEMVQGSVVVGIGVNLCVAPPIEGRRTVSLCEAGFQISRDAFATILTQALDRELERWRTGGLAPLLRRWQSAAHPVGTPLDVRPPGEDPIRGMFAGLSPDGSLRLNCLDGTLRLIHAGDVFLPDTAG